MRISLNWIQEFVKIDRRKAKEIAEKISISLTEVEKIENFRGVDTILEIENKALTHRSDCFSHLGIARETSTIKKLKLKDPLQKLNKKKLRFPKKTLPLKVTITNPELCHRYTTTVLKNIEVKPSPIWIQERLLGCGVRPINNVVDITNFVMLELGQPLHAFDYDKLSDRKKIIIRKARRNERITTLDGIQRDLKTDTLVISTEEKTIAIAGIMGGTNTEVSNNTSTIVLESANFEGVNIRRTGKLVGLHTEATLRFEKGIDPNLTYPALIRAISLLSKYASAKIASPIKDIYPHPPQPKTISIKPQWICKQIGAQIKIKEIERILSCLGFKLEKKDLETIQITVPTFRTDINIPQDFVEEIARIYGYNQIVPTLPIRNLKPISSPKNYNHLQNIKEILVTLGLNEIYSYSFVGNSLYRKCHLDTSKLLALKNPLSLDLKYLRNSIIPSIIEKTELNSHNFNKFGLFEIGKEILPKTRKKAPEEKKKIAGIIYSKTESETFYQAKGILETLFCNMGITQLQFLVPEEIPAFVENTEASRIQVKDQSIAYLGNLNQQVKRNFNLEGNATVFEIDIDTLFSLDSLQKTYKKLTKYPSVFEDLSFIANYTLPVGSLQDKILTVDKQIVNITLKEKPFISEKFGENKKSVTFSIEYQNPQKTLRTNEIKSIRNKIIRTLKENYQVQLRQ